MSNQLLWFSGPPLDISCPLDHGPHHSLQYLAFVAKKDEVRRAGSGERLTAENCTSSGWEAVPTLTETLTSQFGVSDSVSSYKDGNDMDVDRL